MQTTEEDEEGFDKLLEQCHTPIQDTFAGCAMDVDKWTIIIKWEAS